MLSHLLEVSGARRAFADTAALNDVSLSLGKGEIVALLGPNGAGKTTLMRAISGRLRLEHGSVHIAGQDPAKQAAARLKLGLVPQTIALYRQLTARENLEIFGRLMGVAKAELSGRVDQALERADLVERQHDKLLLLSGGMQRRLNIVAATLHQPELLLLDEPTVGVDRDARERIHNLLHELRKDDLGILISTHDFNQAAAIADRAVFMSQGQVLANGTIPDLIGQIFGAERELLVSLHTRAGSEQVQHLQELGLQPAADEFHWSGPVQSGIADVEQRLSAAGIEVDELLLRQPSLESVYTHLIRGTQV